MDIRNRVHRAFGNEEFVSRLQLQDPTAEGHTQASFDHRDQFVGVMHEVIPLAARRVEKLIAGVTAAGPILGHGGLTYRKRKTMFGDQRHWD